MISPWSFRSVEIVHSSVLPQCSIEPHLGTPTTATIWNRRADGRPDDSVLDALRTRPLSDTVWAAPNSSDTDTLKLSVVPAVPQPMGALSLHGHNGTGDDRIRVTGWTDSARTQRAAGGDWQPLRPPLVDPLTLPWGHPGMLTGQPGEEELSQYPGLFRFSVGADLVIGRWDIEIDCRARPATRPLEIGLLFPGRLWAPPWGLDWDGQLVPDHSPEIEEAEGGVEYPDRTAPIRRQVDLRLPGLDRNQALQHLWHLLWTHGKAGELVLSLWPEDSSNQAALSMLARLEDYNGITWRRSGRYPASLTFKEIL